MPPKSVAAAKIKPAEREAKKKPKKLGPPKRERSPAPPSAGGVYDRKTKKKVASNLHDATIEELAKPKKHKGGK